MMKNLILSFFIVGCSCTAAAQTIASVHFALREAELSSEATHTIDSLVSNRSLRPDASYKILGYTDYRGRKGYNDTLSNARATNVKNYLVGKGIPSGNITLCQGRGMINHAPVQGEGGIPAHRKVEIILDKRATGNKTKIDVASVKVNETVNLKNMLFEPGQHEFLPESEDELDNLLAFMRNNSKVKIRIEGHICCMSATSASVDTIDADQSGQLSETRAKAVADFLISKGIDRGRLKHKGYGFSHPLVLPERTDEDRMKNRRVEIRIMEK